MTKKNIIILGGTGAIGSSLAKQIKNLNYNPILVARDKTNLEKISRQLDCEYFECDVLDSEKLKTIINNLDKSIYGLAYCVGSINLKPFKLTKDSDFIESFKINTLGAINAIKAAQSSLLTNNGSILLFSTIAVKQGFVNHSVVSSAKGAIEGLTLSLAAEFSPLIKVNCIAPSLTYSKMSENLVKNENIKKAIEGMHPIPKIGTGEDFSYIGSHLLTDQNKWITGQIFHIDGGRSSLRVRS